MTKKNFASNCFLFIGLIFLSLAIYLNWQRIKPLPQIDQSQNHFPKEIQLADANILLPVIPSKIQDNEWESTTKGVSFLISSPLPGEQGNSIFYGHNYPNLLGNLSKVKKGQKILVKYSNQPTKIFIVSETKIVRANDNTILNKSNDRRITLYTCYGFFDEQRFVVTAILKGRI